MKFFEKFEDSAPSLVVSILLAILAAIAGTIMTILVGAKFFSDELTYGFPMAFGVPVGVIAGVSVLILAYRKLRRLF
jgi:hypothetical protein